jgi:hypothetical protein
MLLISFIGLLLLDALGNERAVSKTVCRAQAEAHGDTIGCDQSGGVMGCCWESRVSEKPSCATVAARDAIAALACARANPINLVAVPAKSRPPDCSRQSFPVGGKPGVRADLKRLKLLAFDWGC